jgi:hypothetical protein
MDLLPPVDIPPVQIRKADPLRDHEQFRIIELYLKPVSRTRRRGKYGESLLTDHDTANCEGGSDLNRFARKSAGTCDFVSFRYTDIVFESTTIKTVNIEKVLYFDPFPGFLPCGPLTVKEYNGFDPSRAVS